MIRKGFGVKNLAFDIVNHGLMDLEEPLDSNGMV